MWTAYCDISPVGITLQSSADTGEFVPHVDTSFRLTSALVLCSWWIARQLILKPLDLGDLRASYLQIPVEGVVGPADFAFAERLLTANGLLQLTGETCSASEEFAAASVLEEDEGRRLILMLLVKRLRPLWAAMLAGFEGDLKNAPFPAEVEELLRREFADPDEREQFLLRLGRRFEHDRQSRTGSLGEEAVVAACKAVLRKHGLEKLAKFVRRVSLVSDQLGYDVVTPTLSGDTARLEVKTSRLTTGATVHFFLSQNEAHVAEEDPHWYLVLCAGRENEADILGWCRPQRFMHLLPKNTDPDGEWVSCRISISLSHLEPGLPLGLAVSDADVCF